jgi:sugar lactone lactonase YvrE
VIRDVPTGVHTVQYAVVTGWVAPPSEPVTITATGAVALVRYYAWVVGQGGTAQGQFSQPRGLACFSNHLYVTDGNPDFGSSPHRVQRLDLISGVWTNWGGTKTNALGGFNQPFGLAVDKAGNLYVADSQNHRIQILDAATGAWTAWGGVNTNALGGFNGPYDVAVDTNGAVYVADHYNDRIQKRAPDGTWSVFVANGSDTGKVKKPNGVRVDANGLVYVSDDLQSGTGRYRIQVFAPSGAYVRTLGSSGTDGGGFSRPMFMAFSPKGALYVADSANNRVMKTDNLSAAVWSDMVAPHVLKEPWGVAVDRMGRLFVADTKNNRVLRFDIENDPVFAVRMLTSRTPSGLSLTWYGKQGWLYSIQCSDTLLDAVWTDLPGYSDLSGTGAALTVDIAGDDLVRQRFYRVVAR